jgi:hypothetical protein
MPGRVKEIGPTIDDGEHVSVGGLDDTLTAKFDWSKVCLTNEIG